MSLLMRPSIKVKSDPANHQVTRGFKHHDMIVDVVAPGFKVGKSALDVRATIQTGTSNQRGQSKRWAAQEELVPYKMEPLYQDDKKIEQIGCRYYYQTVGAKHVTFRSRARHITEDGLIIPTLPVEDAKTGDPVKIDNEVPGWAYAEKPVGITRV
jgi:hypothetical protein